MAVDDLLLLPFLLLLSVSECEFRKREELKDGILNFEIPGKRRVEIYLLPFSFPFIFFKEIFLYPIKAKHVGIGESGWPHLFDTGFSRPLELENFKERGNFSTAVAPEV